MKSRPVSVWVQSDKTGGGREVNYAALIYDARRLGSFIVFEWNLMTIWNGNEVGFIMNSVLVIQ